MTTMTPFKNFNKIHLHHHHRCCQNRIPTREVLRGLVLMYLCMIISCCFCGSVGGRGHGFAAAYVAPVRHTSRGGNGCGVPSILSKAAPAAGAGTAAAVRSRLQSFTSLSSSTSRNISAFNVDGLVLPKCPDNENISGYRRALRVARRSKKVDSELDTTNYKSVLFYGYMDDEEIKKKYSITDRNLINELDAIISSSSSSSSLKSSISSSSTTSSVRKTMKTTTTTTFPSAFPTSSTTTSASPPFFAKQTPNVIPPPSKSSSPASTSFQPSTSGGQPSWLNQKQPPQQQQQQQQQQSSTFPSFGFGGGAASASTSNNRSNQDTDRSVPYDAAAKLAYESSNKSIPYEMFKRKYEADAIADVMSKQSKIQKVKSFQSTTTTFPATSAPVASMFSNQEQKLLADTSVPYDAAAKLAYEASNKALSYETFKKNYEKQAIADVIAKQQKSKGKKPSTSSSSYPTTTTATPSTAGSFPSSSWGSSWGTTTATSTVPTTASFGSTTSVAAPSPSFPSQSSSSSATTATFGATAATSFGSTSTAASPFPSSSSAATTPSFGSNAATSFGSTSAAAEVAPFSTVPSQSSVSAGAAAKPKSFSPFGTKAKEAKSFGSTSAATDVAPFSTVPSQSSSSAGAAAKPKSYSPFGTKSASATAASKPAWSSPFGSSTGSATAEAKPTSFSPFGSSTVSSSAESKPKPPSYAPFGSSPVSATEEPKPTSFSTFGSSTTSTTAEPEPKTTSYSPFGSSTTSTTTPGKAKSFAPFGTKPSSVKAGKSPFPAQSSPSGTTASAFGDPAGSPFQSQSSGTSSSTSFGAAEGSPFQSSATTTSSSPFGSTERSPFQSSATTLSSSPFGAAEGSPFLSQSSATTTSSSSSGASAGSSFPSFASVTNAFSSMFGSSTTSTGDSLPSQSSVTNTSSSTFGSSTTSTTGASFPSQSPATESQTSPTLSFSTFGSDNTAKASTSAPTQSSVTASASSVVSNTAPASTSPINRFRSATTNAGSSTPTEQQQQKQRGAGIYLDSDYANAKRVTSENRDINAYSHPMAKMPETTIDDPSIMKRPPLPSTDSSSSSRSVNPMLATNYGGSDKRETRKMVDQFPIQQTTSVSYLDHIQGKNQGYGAKIPNQQTPIDSAVDTKFTPSTTTMATTTTAIEAGAQSEVSISSPTVQLAFSVDKTSSMADTIEPLNTIVRVLRKGSTKQKIKVYSEDANNYPISLSVETPGSEANQVTIQNTSPSNMGYSPVLASLDGGVGRLGMETVMPHTIQGNGQLQLYPLDASVKSAQVLLQSSQRGGPVNARIELMKHSGSHYNSEKPVVIEVLTPSDFGLDRPFYGVVETPGDTEYVIRVTNLSPSKFPLAVHVKGDSNAVAPQTKSIASSTAKPPTLGNQANTFETGSDNQSLPYWAAAREPEKGFPAEAFKKEYDEQARNAQSPYTGSLPAPPPSQYAVKRTNESQNSSIWGKDVFNVPRKSYE